jgi:DNA-binding transcriptional MerR regulator
VRRQRQRKPTTFTPAAVCKAFGIPSGTLNSWAYHGWFDGFDAERTKPGQARKFTFNDLIRLAILKRLVDFGIRAEQAKPLATLCVVLFEDPSIISEFSVSFGAEGSQAEMWANGNRISEPSGTEPVVKITVYPKAIIDALKERLGVS